MFVGESAADGECGRGHAECVRVCVRAGVARGGAGGGPRRRATPPPPARGRGHYEHYIQSVLKMLLVEIHPDRSEHLLFTSLYSSSRIIAIHCSRWAARLRSH